MDVTILAFLAGLFLGGGMGTLLMAIVAGGARKDRRRRWRQR